MKMKLLLLLLLLEFKPLCIVHAQSVRTLTQEQAWSIVQNEILGKKIDSINVRGQVFDSAFNK